MYPIAGYCNKQYSEIFGLLLLLQMKLNSVTYFCPRKLSFIILSSPRSFLLLQECLHSCYIYFHCSYVYSTGTIISLKPCAWNAETWHFIPRFSKISLLCGYQTKWEQFIITTTNNNINKTDLIWPHVKSNWQKQIRSPAT
jgi:hypothetical protein